MTTALDLLGGMVLEDDRRWGDRAVGWQWDCARCLLDPTVPPFRWESRPRGGSKTTDVAGVVLAAMLTQLAPGSRCDAYAGDRDQARLLVDALAGLVRRTPELAGAVTVDQYRVTTTAGVVLEVMAADGATAFGRRPSWVVVDEVCNWPGTANTMTLWEAIASSLPKVPGARLAVITTSGDPIHWTRKVRDQAVTSPLWSVAEIPGPLPWIAADQLAEQRRLLPDSIFARLHLNEWAASEDRLVGPDVLAEATVLDGPLLPRRGVSYAIGVDLGLRHDRTAVAVAHVQPVGEVSVQQPRRHRAVLDELVVLEGSREREVDLGQVEELVLGLSRRFNRARVRFDPWQAVGLAQRLRGRGVVTEEATFAPKMLAGLAMTLLTLLRDRLLWLPDDAGLLDELGSVRLRESGSTGLLRIDHAAGGHDDRVTALGLAVSAVLDRAGWSRGAPSSGRAVPYTYARVPGGAVPYGGRSMFQPDPSWPMSGSLFEDPSNREEEWIVTPTRATPPW